MLLNLFLIACIVVIIVDLSGIIDSIKYAIGKMLGAKDYHNIKLKPFECSFCMTFWISLIYIIVMGELTLFNIFYICLMSTFTTIIKDTILTLKDLFTKILNLFQWL